MNQKLQDEVKIKKLQFKKIQEKVQQKVIIEEKKRLEAYLASQMKSAEQEKKILVKRQKDLAILQKKVKIKQSTEKNLKILNAISEAERFQENRTRQILEKQDIALKRMEEQKEKQTEESIKKKELFNIKKELAELNALHKARKEKYNNQKVVEKMSFAEERTSKFSSFKEEMKRKRLANQNDSQLQREKIRGALNQMEVWKVYDIDVVQKIVTNPKSDRGPSLEERIRRKAAENSRSQSKLYSSFQSI